MPILNEYAHNIAELFDHLRVTNAWGEEIGVDTSVQMALNAISDCGQIGGKIILIGNGGSASIASHLAVDLWKNGGIKAISFNDAALLTCVGNDYGYEEVFSKPIQMFAEQDDIVIAVSSSGKSQNMIRGATMAKECGGKVITLSGFDPHNPLSRIGWLNFFIPSSFYGPVEIAHLMIGHFLVDCIVRKKGKSHEYRQVPTRQS